MPFWVLVAQQPQIKEGPFHIDLVAEAATDLFSEALKAQRSRRRRLSILECVCNISRWKPCVVHITKIVVRHNEVADELGIARYP